MDSRLLSPEGRLATYLILAIPFAAANLAYLYWRQRAVGRRRRLERFIVRSTILVLFIATEVAYFQNHDLYLDANLNDGPFVLFFPGFLASFALVGLAAALAWRSAEPGRSRRGHFVVALAFLVEPAFESGFRVLVWIMTSAPTTWLAIADLAIRMAMALIVLVALAVFAMPSRSARATPHGQIGEEERTAGLVLGAALISGVAVFVTFQTAPPIVGASLFWIMNSFWLLAAALGLTYAIVRYRVLESDRMMRFAIKQSTFAAIIGIIFVVTSETLELLIDASDRTIAIAIAVGLAGLFRMLQRASGMIVQQLLPADATSRAVRRQEVYEAALEGILVDGAVTPKERMVLDALVEKLELDPEEARRLEDDVLLRFAGAA